jgi:hypothetical protein
MAMHIATSILPPQHPVIGKHADPITADLVRLIGDVAAGSILYNCRDQYQVLRIGVGH